MQCDRSSITYIHVMPRQTSCCNWHPRAICQNTHDATTKCTQLYRDDDNDTRRIVDPRKSHVVHATHVELRLQAPETHVSTMQLRLYIIDCLFPPHKHTWDYAKASIPRCAYLLLPQTYWICICFGICFVYEIVSFVDRIKFSRYVYDTFFFL